MLHAVENRDDPQRPDGGDIAIPITVPSALVDALAEIVAAELAPHVIAAVRAMDRAAEGGREALTYTQVGHALGGISADSVERHVAPHVRVLRVASKKLIPVTELSAWIERNASLLGELR